MNASEYRVLDRYVRRVADLMGLRDWHIEVSRDAPSSTKWVAECCNVPGRQVAFIRFRDDFAEHDVNLDQVSTVVHELLHCVTARTTDQVDDDLKMMLPKSGYTAFRESYLRSNEYQIDTLAEALARLMPPIPWRR